MWLFPAAAQSFPAACPDSFREEHQTETRGTMFFQHFLFLFWLMLLPERIYLVINSSLTRLQLVIWYPSLFAVCWFSSRLNCCCSSIDMSSQQHSWSLVVIVIMTFMLPPSFLLNLMCRCLSAFSHFSSFTLLFSHFFSILIAQVLQHRVRMKGGYSCESIKYLYRR